MSCKVFNILLLLALSGFIINVCGVPVFIWNWEGQIVTRHPIFPDVVREKFERTLKQLTSKGNLIVAFTTAKLTHNDFRYEDNYPYLSTLTFDEVIYFNAKNPCRVYRDYVGDTTFVEAEPTPEERSVNVDCDKYYKIKLNQFEPMEYDRVIEQIVNETREGNKSNDTLQCNTIFMLTEDEPPEPPDDESNINIGDGTLFASDPLFLYISRVIVKERGRRPIELKPVSMNVEADGDLLNVTLSTVDVSDYEEEITFEMDCSRGYCKIKYFVYRGYKFYTSFLEAPTTMSYSCSLLELENSFGWLIFKGLQFETRDDFDEEDLENFRFSDNWDCVGFFTPGILSGLVVVSLMMCIAAIGINMLFSTQTPTKFDTPGAPTIRISHYE